MIVLKSIRDGPLIDVEIKKDDGLFKVFKTLAGDGFQTLQTGGGCCASRPAGPGIFLSVLSFLLMLLGTVLMRLSPLTFWMFVLYNGLSYSAG